MAQTEFDINTMTEQELRDHLNGFLKDGKSGLRGAYKEGGLTSLGEQVLQDMEGKLLELEQQANA